MKLLRVTILITIAMTSTAAHGTVGNRLDIVDAVNCIPALKNAGLYAVSGSYDSVTLNDGHKLPVRLQVIETPYGPIIKHIDLY